MIHCQHRGCIHIYHILINLLPPGFLRPSLFLFPVVPSLQFSCWCIYWKNAAIFSKLKVKPIRIWMFVKTVNESLFCVSAMSKEKEPLLSPSSPTSRDPFVINSLNSLSDLRNEENQRLLAQHTRYKYYTKLHPKERLVRTDWFTFLCISYCTPNFTCRGPAFELDKGILYAL